MGRLGGLPASHFVGIMDLPAYSDPDNGGLRVWCGWCVRWHHHGNGYGHRVAHCTVGTSPYVRNGGYNLVEPGAGHFGAAF
jgi:hypothetical protein